MSSGSNFYQHLYFASLLLFLTPNLFYFCLFYFIFLLLQSTVRTLMVTLSLPRTHGLFLWSPQSSPIRFRSFRRSYVAASSSAFANENRESVSDFIFLCLFNFEFEVEIDDVSQFLVIFVFFCFGEGLWSLEVAMPQAMRLGLSSNMTWPMDASVLCLKRSIYLFLAFANLVCLVTNHYVLKYYISQNLELIGS